MSAMSDELMSENEACWYLEIDQQSLRASAEQGLLKSIEADSPRGKIRLYYRSEVIRLKERLTRMRNKLQSQQDEWPELIEVD
jgi:hypothetical protein